MFSMVPFCNLLAQLIPPPFPSRWKVYDLSQNSSTSPPSPQGNINFLVTRCGWKSKCPASIRSSLGMMICGGFFSLFITSCLLIIRLIYPWGEKCSNLLHFVVLAGLKVKAVSSVNITRIWVVSVAEVDEKEHIGEQLSNINFLVARFG